MGLIFQSPGVKGLKAFDDDVLILVNVVLFFQGKDFIIGLRMVGPVLAAVFGSFLLLVVFLLPFAAESISDNGGCIAGCFDCLGCFSSCDLVGGCSCS